MLAWLAARLAIPLAVAALMAAPAHAQSVALHGILGARALLTVDGGAPRSVRPGESHQGVKLVSIGEDEAVVEIGGQRQTVRLGASPSVVGGTGAVTRSSRIVLTAGDGGHFMAQGAINGRATQFMVDTGATTVSLGLSDAQHMGVDYQKGQPVRMTTANGVARGWRVKLASVRVGDVELYDVDAVVGEQSMPFVLLGNSFLTRFQMRRVNDLMVLERRY